MKTLFFGTPQIAVPFLDALAKRTEVAAVVTNPDEPAGRHYDVKPSPVKEAALRLGLHVFQPESLKAPSPLLPLPVGEGGGEGRPDFCLVVAYGKLIPAELLKIPKHGFLNVHFSLLPAYRGAAPIQRALMNGERQTGATLFWLDAGMDTGNIFLQKALPIADEDDAEELRHKLVPAGLELLDQAISRIEKKDIARVPQQGTASKAPMLKKEEGRIDWKKPAAVLHNLVRGTVPWPSAATSFTHQGKKLQLKVLKSMAAPASKGKPGEIIDLVGEKGPIVKCGQDALLLLTVQPEGKRAMSAWEFWQGARLKIGDQLG